MANLLKELGYNEKSWIHVYLELQELYMSVFEWENLPISCNGRYIEMSLMMRNQAVFFIPKEIEKPVCLKSSMIGLPDIYGDPIKVRAFGNNGFSEEINLRDDGVVFFDTKTRTTPIERLKLFAKRIVNQERTIDINIHQQRTPRLWGATKDTEHTIKTILNRVNNYSEDLVLVDTMSESPPFLNVVNPAPFVAAQIRIEKNAIWSEAMTYCGIQSNSAEKKERVTPDEVEVSNGQARHKLKARFDERKLACEKINKKYGLNISVKISDEVLQSFDEAKKEGDDIE